MKVNELWEAVGTWDADYVGEDIDSTSKYQEILHRLEFLGKYEWCNYLPAESPTFEIDFMRRLARWVGNIDEPEDQKLMLEYVQQISFFSHQDFVALYRAAYNGPITRWVITKAGLQYGSPNFDKLLEEELKRHTWYCPITDSMDINEFYHANHISGVEHRPAFSTLALINPLNKDPNQTLIANLMAFLNKPDRGPRKPRPLKRLVLLEDFVGSGSQMKSAIKWAAERLGIQVLVVPLIICEPGVKVLDDLMTKYPDLLSSSPVVTIDSSELLGLNGGLSNTWEYRTAIEDLSRRVEKSRGIPDPFGYKNTGCSVVTYSNTPNNSLALIHYRKRGKCPWNSLFPRSARA